MTESIHKSKHVNVSTKNQKMNFQQEIEKSNIEDEFLNTSDILDDVNEDSNPIAKKKRNKRNKKKKKKTGEEGFKETEIETQ